MRILSTSILIFFTTSLIGQKYVNKLVDMGFERQFTYMVGANDTTLVVSGRALESVENLVYHAYYAEVDDILNLTNYISYTQQGQSLHNNLINDVVFQNGKFINSFHTQNIQIIYEVVSDSLNLLDTLINPIDEMDNIILSEFYKDLNDDIWYSGTVYEESPPGSGLRYTHTFIKKLNSKEYEQEIFLSNNYYNFFGGIIPLTKSGSYLLVSVDSNLDEEVTQEWSMQTIIQEVDDEQNILQSWTSSRDDRFGLMNKMYLLPDGSLIIASKETKQNEEIPFLNVNRDVLFKFSFEQGIHWKSYPYGMEWDSSYVGDGINEIIPTIEGDGYIVAGEKLISDSLGTYAAGAISKVDKDGNVAWYENYNAGYAGLYTIQDIVEYQGDYVAVGYVLNLENAPADLPRIPSWFMRIDSEGGFVGSSSTVELQSKEKSNQIWFYPNPSSDYIVLSDEIKPDSRLDILDIEGRIVKQVFSLYPGERVLLDEVPKGVYIIRLHFKSDRIVSGKLIVK